MPTDYLRILSSLGAENIVKDLVSKRMVGIGVWNITRKKFTIVEDITGFDQNYYSTLTDFVEKIIHPLDKQMVLAELKKYTQQPTEDYQRYAMHEVPEHRFQSLP